MLHSTGSVEFNYQFVHCVLLSPNSHGVDKFRKQFRNRNEFEFDGVSGRRPTHGRLSRHDHQESDIAPSPRREAYFRPGLPAAVSLMLISRDVLVSAQVRSSVTVGSPTGWTRKCAFFPPAVVYGRPIISYSPVSSAKRSPRSLPQIELVSSPDVLLRSCGSCYRSRATISAGSPLCSASRH